MFDGQLVFVRAGNVLSVYAGMGVTTIMGGGQLDPTEFEHSSATGVQKLSTV